jgi:hypothetical protein
VGVWGSGGGGWNEKEMPVIVVSFASMLGRICLYTRSLLTSGWGDGMSRRESKGLRWRDVQTDRHTTQVDQDPRHTETQTERQTETHRPKPKPKLKPIQRLRQRGRQRLTDLNLNLNLNPYRDSDREADRDSQT